MIFTESDHARLATLFDGVRETRPYDATIAQPAFNVTGTPYPGYRPEVREAPNGDTKACPECGGAPYHEDDCLDDSACECPPNRCCTGCKGTGRVPNVDAEGPCPALSRSLGQICAFCRAERGEPCRGAPAKRFLHVAPKYDPPAWAVAYLARAHWEACRVAEALNVPAAYYPRVADGTLRVLEYPAGAGTAEHTDFNLFTIVLWRSTPGDLVIKRTWQETQVPAEWESRRIDGARLSPGLHIGELGELVGLGPATPHRVPARPYTQKSLIYFALPSHSAELPRPVTFEAQGGLARVTAHTVGQWLAARKARSRYA